MQASLISLEHLDDGEIAWVDAYHDRVWRTVGPLLHEGGHHEAREWLREATRPLRQQLR